MDIGLKWPNDIYANGSTKIGGVLVNSTIHLDTIVCNIGVGINLSNCSPTVSINELVKEFNLRHKKNLSLLEYEYLLAKIFNSIENLYGKVQEEGDIHFLYELYYNLWLHR